MRLTDLLKNWWKQVAAVVGVIALIVKFYPLLEGLVERWIVQRGLIAGALVVLVLASSLLIYALYAYSKLKEKESAGEKRIEALDLKLKDGNDALTKLKGTFTVKSKEIEALQGTFSETLAATNLIASQLFPAQPKPMRTVLRLQRVLTIMANGDCRFHETHVFAGKNHDIHFVEQTIGPSDGEPALFPSDISLEITSGTPGNKVATLISDNRPQQKSFVIFFLPFIQKGGQDEREVVVNYQWKGTFRPLFQDNKDEFQSSAKSSDPIPSVEYQFWLSPGLGTLKCSNIGSLLPAGSEQLKELQDKAKGMDYWQYTATNVPSGHETRLQLEIS